MAARYSLKNKKLHTAWRAKVLERDQFCQVCGPDVVNKKLDAHHLIPKEFHEWRWDVSNGMILCVMHHTLGKFSAHKNPVWFTLWLRREKKAIFELVYKRIQGLI